MYQSPLAGFSDQPKEEAMDNNDIQVRTFFTELLHIADTTFAHRSVSFMTGYQEEILSVTVPLADQETTGTVSTDDLEMTLSMPTQI